MHTVLQVPIVHVAAALAADGHALLQAPQFVADVCVFVSHPFATIASQSPNPVSHVPSTQLLAVHVGTLCTVLHAVAHAPQCAGSLVRSTQLVPHRICPVGHGGSVHMPAEHISPLAHACAHDPQLAMSVWASTQFVPHRVWPVEHIGTQLPPWHASLAAQACPHAPQFVASLCRFTQVPAQRVSPIVVQGVATHAPRVHVSPAAQVCAHEPQFIASA
jgi:hypothetical protein